MPIIFSRQNLQNIIEAIGKTGMAVAAIIGVVLDNLIPGTPRERGLEPAAPAAS